MAQASFDAFCLPRHVGLYSGVPVPVPAYLVQRVCGTGIETLLQAADAITLRRIELALCVGTESMSRNPIAAYTHRGGFVLGRVEFKDFLWEALMDPAAGVTMGDTAERLAREYKLTREEVDQFASESFDRALAAQKSGFLAGEITPVRTETFELAGYKSRGIRLPRKVEELAVDTHVRPSPPEALAKLPPAFGGVQTGATARRSSTARSPRWSAPGTTHGPGGRRRWAASWRAPWPASHPRTWASGRWPRSGHCWNDAPCS